MFSLTDLSAGDWYISIVCLCGERLVLFSDLTQGRGSLKGSLELTCPSCGKRGSYPAEHYRYEPSSEARLLVRHAS